MNSKRPIEDEINFRRVAKTPLRWFGLVYPYMIIVIIVIGLFYIDSLDTITRNKVEPSLFAKFGEYQDIKAKPASFLEGVNVSQEAIATNDKLTQGKQLYDANCASCHGAGGKGDGAGGETLNPKPRDLTTADGWKNGAKIAQIFKTLEEGIPGTGMAAYEYLPVADRFSIIHYTRSFLAEPPVDSKEELSELDAVYQLSEGRYSPAQIPVSLAAKNIADGIAPKAAVIYSLLEEFKADCDKYEIQLFGRVAKCKFRALAALYSNDIWHQSPESFLNVAILSAGAGFKPEIARLSDNDLKTLHNYLKMKISPVN